MHVLHVPYGFFPDTPGGTEQYVAALAHRQVQQGFKVTIAAPAVRAARYVHEGLPVERYPLSATLELVDLWGAGDPVAAAAFGQLLDRVKPDLVHLHAYTAGVSLRIAQDITRGRIPLVFTYHSPSVTCARGTLLRWGSDACSGQLSSEPCATCTLASYGLPRLIALAAQPAARLASHLNVLSGGGLSTAVRIPELVALRNRCVLEFLEQPARIMVPAQWSLELLARNGQARDRIVLVRHGLDPDTLRSAGELSRAQGQPGTELRIAFLGRLDPAKGAHLLIEALERDARLPVRLVLFGLEQQGAYESYRRALRNRARQDSRIEVRRALPHVEVIAAMRDFDIIAVPSIVLETGPLVVLEAFAAGVPVVGTRLGGIAELVMHRHNGLLIDASPAAWQAALAELVQQPALLQSLRAGIEQPRTLEAVADDVARVYQMVRT
jgi:glycosyltransferase involved in cell wall biosynthesis